MTDDQRRDHDVRSWIQSEAPDHAPEHLRTTVRSELAQTRQERGTAVFMRRSWFRSSARIACCGGPGPGIGGRCGRAPRQPIPDREPRPDTHLGIDCPVSLATRFIVCCADAFRGHPFGGLPHH